MGDSERRKDFRQCLSRGFLLAPNARGFFGSEPTLVRCSSPLSSPPRHFLSSYSFQLHDIIQFAFRAQNSSKMPPRRAAGRAPGQLSGPAVPSNESAWQKFLRTEIYAPEKRTGNWSYVTGIGLFAGSIFAVRVWGHALVPT
ncbi:hypothetical protein CALVIDRAFT_541110 [Calocera viscosa TUFC12733]|uniref:Uncharacterized protein n=1 Tax=Calocera viscosa (strain TUFC12733) TaxID=1330018 RepID=A0A167I481_CALVF|nr:hypothetical protein CALVIDRAFT_541110 [Calocera viscosa TUFC12733]